MFSWENIRRKSKPIVAIAWVVAFAIMLMPSLILIMEMPTEAAKNTAESSISTKTKDNSSTEVNTTIQISTTTKSPYKLRRSDESDDAFRPSLNMTTTTTATSSSSTTLTETSTKTATATKPA